LDIGQQLGQEIAAGLGAVDQMMMRVDDREIGVDDLFPPAAKPIGPYRQVWA
jgi:hypothetical protein